MSRRGVFEHQWQQFAISSWPDRYERVIPTEDFVRVEDQLFLPVRCDHLHSLELLSPRRDLSR